MLAAMQERTQYRPTADSALMRWIVRHAAWLIPRFRSGDVQSPFCRAMGVPYRGKLVKFGETVLAHLPEVGKGNGNPRTEAGGLTEVWRVAGQERSHGRTLSEQGTESHMLEVYDDMQRTAGQTRRSGQSSRPHRSRGRQQQTIQPMFEQYQKYVIMTTKTRKRTRTTVRTRSLQTSQRTTTMACRERRLRSLTQLQRRVQDEERSA